MKLTRTITYVCLAASLTAFGSLPAHAQGKGHAGGRGLGSAASGAGRSAAVGGPVGSAAGGAMARGGVGVKPTAPGASRGMSGLSRASSSVERSATGQAANAHKGTATNPQERILQHRAQQAQHLRDISARNGNESLLETADRMDANSLANYQRQTQVEPTPQDGAPAVSGSTAATLPTSAKPAVKAKRGFWFRSR